MSIHAATRWSTNAQMMADVMNLGYLRYGDAVVDLTFGKGKWWSEIDTRKFVPFVAVFPPGTGDDAGMQTFFGSTVVAHCDFRDLPAEWTGRFDVVTFDPPYVSMGGRSTSKLPDFMDRYGLEDAPRTPRELHNHNARGLYEARRVTKPGGFVMTKCAPYISSGRYQPGDVWMANAAVSCGLEIKDRLIHVGHTRPQPPGRGQQHARNNYSVLWIFRKPGSTRRRR